MKLGNLIILVVACIVVGGIALVLMNERNQAWDPGAVDDLDPDELLFPNLPVNAVDRLGVRGPNGQVTIARRDGRWVVANKHGYPADFTQVKNLIVKLSELKPVQSLIVTEADHERLHFLEPPETTATEAPAGTGTRLTLSQGEETILSFLLGKEHEKSDPRFGSYPNGRYLLLAGGSVAVVDETFAAVQDTPDEWLDKSFVKREGTVRRAEAFKDGQSLWELRREDTGASLTLTGDIPEGLEPNPTKISALDRVLDYPSFSDVGNPERTREEWGFPETGRAFELETFEGFTYRFEIGPKTAEGYYPVVVNVAFTEPPPPAPPADDDPTLAEQRRKNHEEMMEQRREKFRRERDIVTGWVFLMPSYGVEDMLLDREGLLQQPKDEAGAETGAETTPTPPPPPDPEVETEELEPAEAEHLEEGAPAPTRAPVDTDRDAPETPAAPEPPAEAAAPATP